MLTGSLRSKDEGSGTAAQNGNVMVVMHERVCLHMQSGLLSYGQGCMNMTAPPLADAVEGRDVAVEPDACGLDVHAGWGCTLCFSQVVFCLTALSMRIFERLQRKTAVALLLRRRQQG